MPPSKPLQTAKIDALRSQIALEDIQIVLKNRTWNLTISRDQDAILRLVQATDNVPYGFLLWESAIALASYMEEHPEFVQNRRILELGAGLGFAGLVAQSLGGQVSQTDHIPDVLSLAAHNAQQNGLEGIERFVADWRRWKSREQYDVLLGSDILYQKLMHPYLTAVFDVALAPGGILLLSDPLRPQAFQFVSQLEHRGWRFTLDTLKVPNEGIVGGKEIEIALYVGRR